MVKKTVTYTNFDGKSRTRDLYFHMNKMEANELDLEYGGHFAETAQRAVDEDNRAEIFQHFKSLLKRAYGQKSADGERFEKSEEIWKAFEESNAYEAFFDYLIAHPDEIKPFMFAIFPEDVRKKMEEADAEQNHADGADTGA